MLLVAPVQPEQRVDSNGASGTGLDRVKQVRSTVPAITHVDYSARVQTLDEVRFPRFYGLVKAFHERTGCPVVINTSFNVRGEPIVNTPEQAYRCFLATDIDVLVLENCVLRKTEQKNRSAPGREDYLKQFALD